VIGRSHSNRLWFISFFGIFFLFAACSDDSTEQTSDAVPGDAALRDAGVEQDASGTAPLDCVAIQTENASATSGLYQVTAPLGKKDQAWCDFDSTGAVWTRRAAPLRRGGSTTGGLTEMVIADPDVRIDALGTWHIYYQGSRTTQLGSDDEVFMVVHGTSSDGIEWQIDEQPAMAAPQQPDPWDASQFETPTVVYDSNAPSGIEYKMYYSGAASNLRGGQVDRFPAATPPPFRVRITASI